MYRALEQALSMIRAFNKFGIIIIIIIIIIIDCIGIAYTANTCQLSADTIPFQSLSFLTVFCLKFMKDTNLNILITSRQVEGCLWLSLWLHSLGKGLISGLKKVLGQGELILTKHGIAASAERTYSDVIRINTCLRVSQDQ